MLRGCGALILCLVIVACVAAVFVMSGTGSSPSTPSPTQNGTATGSMGNDLATIDGNLDKVAEYDALLNTLSQKYPDGRDKIGDATANVHKMCTDKGKPVTCLKILKDLAAMPDANQTYVDTATAYAQLKIGL